MNKNEEQARDNKEERSGKRREATRGRKSEGKGRQREVDERGWDGYKRREEKGQRKIREE